MKNVDSNPDFILVTGDWASHSQPTFNTTLQSITNATQTLLQFFPKTLVIPALGNNDVWPDYNASQCNDLQLSQIAKLWSQVGWLTSAQTTHFLDNGAFVVHHHQNLHVIVMNTVYYACKDKYYNHTEADPCGQFAWLSSQLQSQCSQGPQHRVWITGHIAPGGVQWKTMYFNTFLSIVSNYVPCIAGMFFGHTHLDQFFHYNSPKIAGLLAPSITTLQNNPAFRYVNYDPNSKVAMDYVQYYLPLLQANINSNTPWSVEYSFQDQYGPYPQGITHSTLRNLSERLFNNDTLYDTWHRNEFIQYEDSRWQELCLTKATNPQDYWVCRSVY